MSLTAQQTAAKAIFTTADGPVFPFNGDSHTIDAWYTLGADNACMAYMNDPAVGAGQNKTCPRTSVPAASVKAAIVNSSDYPAMSAASGLLAALDFAIGQESVQLVTSGNVVELATGMNNLLKDSYAAANGKFNALKTRASSVWEFITQTDGAQFTQSDISAIRAG